MTSTSARRPASSVPRPRTRVSGHPGYDLRLDCLPSSAALARRAARTTMRCWGLPEDLTADAELIACELVTNAIVHSGVHGRKGPGRCRLALERPAPDLVRIEVLDRSPARPVRREPGEDDTDGRGLALVAALALDWGVTGRPGGKAVRALLGARA